MPPVRRMTLARAKTLRGGNLTLLRQGKEGKEMRKLAVLLAAFAAAVVAAPASADVARYQFQTATFAVTQPAGTVGQWAAVWTHKIAVTIDPCDQTFTGTAAQYAPGTAPPSPPAYTETVTGSLGAGTISMDFVRSDGVRWSLTNALYQPFVNLAKSVPAVPWALEAKVTPLTITGTSDWKNHGEYVKSLGGGVDAAHSCIGMPITEPAAFQWSATGSVDSASTSGTTVTLPVAGTYRIDVMGTWTNDGWGWLDAEYTDNGAGGYANGFDRNGYLLGEGFGDLQVNGQFVDWGAYSSVHVYTLAMPLAGTVKLAVFDGNSNPPAAVMPWYGDNSGSLTYAITYLGP